MQGVPAIYLGRIVEKEHFRAFIYGPNGSKKLVNSWDEYEQHMETGLWFATVEQSQVSVVVEEKPKRVRNKPVPVMTLELKEEPLIEEELIQVEAEVVDVKKDDDFLPKGSK